MNFGKTGPRRIIDDNPWVMYRGPVTKVFRTILTTFAFSWKLHKNNFASAAVHCISKVQMSH
jgi:hypothetical protein